MFAVELYELPDGKIPVKEFIAGLSPKIQAKAINSIAILEEFGTKLREPYSKPIKDGIFELRIQFASDIARIFYFFCVNNRIILTNGFIKKAKKAPPEEIRKAIKYKTDYERRHPHE